MRVRTLALLFASLTAVACDPGLDVVHAPGYEHHDGTHRARNVVGASFSAINRAGQTWSYCGATEFEADVVSGVKWWETHGRRLGARVPCENRAHITFRDLTGVESIDATAWSDWDVGGADIRLYRLFFTLPEWRTATIRHELGHIFGFGDVQGLGCLMAHPSNSTAGELCQEERTMLGI